MTTADPPILMIDGLRLQPGEAITPWSLDLSLRPGERMLVHGPSGCGKSSLLKAILGLMPTSAGTITIAGEQIGPQNCWQLRRSISWAPQHLALAPGSVIEALRTPFNYQANQHLHWDEGKASELCRQLDLPTNILKRQTGKLSGGENQRLALVLALLLERPLLLVDEPIAGLDQDRAERIVSLLNDQPGRAILCISHDDRFFVDWPSRALRTPTPHGVGP